MRFLNYLSSLLIAPKKTFGAIVEDQKISNQIIPLVICAVILLLLHQLIPTRQTSNTLTTPTAVLIQKFLDNVSRYSLVIFIPTWFIEAVILHLISRLFSKNGKLTLMIISLGFSSVLGSVVFLIVKVVNLFIPLSTLSTLVTLWLIYLSVLAVSSVYLISIKRSVLIVLIQLVIMVILFMTAMFTYVLVNS